MNDINLLGIDLAKSVFQLIGLNKEHKVVCKKRLNRSGLLKYVSNLKPCTIYMEACGASNHWGRTFGQLGHDVKLISPQHVTPYVRSQKNDYNDTEAILEAGTRPRTNFVQVKTIEQQDIQSILRMRERIVNIRVSLSNQVRGLLLEYGIAMKQGYKALGATIAELISADNDTLSDLMKECLSDLYDEFKSLSERVDKYDKTIGLIAKENEVCRRLNTIPGVGPIVATALFSTLGTGKHFKNGRQMAANVGLIPKQHSSGERQLLLGITKNGDSFLRKVLIHGARAVVSNVKNKTDRRSLWVHKLLITKHFNVVATAIANRTVRIAWALMQSGETYNAEKVAAC